MTGTPVDERGEHRWISGALVSVALLALAGIGTGAGVLALGALVPALGIVGAFAPIIVPVWGPALVASGAVATAVAWLLRRRLPRTATAVAAVCGLGAVSLAVVIGIVATAVVRAGGSVDPWRALVPATHSVQVAPAQRPVYSTTADGHPLHLAVWRPGRGTGRAPVFVYVHGGGWIGGTELGRSADLHRIAEHGWLTVSVEYSLARAGRPTWNLNGPEVACALTRVARLAGEQGGDPTRLVLAGDSAGGQLAISVGYHAASQTQPSSCGGVVPVPRAIATDYPAADLVDGYDHGQTGGPPELDARYLAITYTGGTPDQVPERYRAVSGADAITAAALPTLVIAPGRDSLVPPVGLARFVQRVQAVGVDATLVKIPFANHAFDMLADGSLGQQAGSSILENWSAERVAK